MASFDPREIVEQTLKKFCTSTGLNYETTFEGLTPIPARYQTPTAIDRKAIEENAIKGLPALMKVFQDNPIENKKLGMEMRYDEAAGAKVVVKKESCKIPPTELKALLDKNEVVEVENCLHFSLMGFINAHPDTSIPLIRELLGCMCSIRVPDHQYEACICYLWTFDPDCNVVLTGDDDVERLSSEDGFVHSAKYTIECLERNLNPSTHVLCLRGKQMLQMRADKEEIRSADWKTAIEKHHEHHRHFDDDCTMSLYSSRAHPKPCSEIHPYDADGNDAYERLRDIFVQNLPKPEAEDTDDGEDYDESDTDRTSDIDFIPQDNIICFCEKKALQERLLLKANERLEYKEKIRIVSTTKFNPLLFFFNHILLPALCPVSVFHKHILSIPFDVNRRVHCYMRRNALSFSNPDPVLYIQQCLNDYRIRMHDYPLASKYPEHFQPLRVVVDELEKCFQ